MKIILPFDYYRYNAVNATGKLSTVAEHDQKYAETKMTHLISNPAKSGLLTPSELEVTLLQNMIFFFISREVNDLAL